MKAAIIILWLVGLVTISPRLISLSFSSLGAEVGALVQVSMMAVLVWWPKFAFSVIEEKRKAETLPEIELASEMPEIDLDGQTAERAGISIGMVKDEGKLDEAMSLLTISEEVEKMEDGLSKDALRRALEEKNREFEKLNERLSN
ncbi:hypothetical protein N9E90_00490 [Akkermansiaceae bacterium]|nr:hypothetical protein [Akkermansiaceae bacterium]